MTALSSRLFLAACAQAGLPAPVPEYRFHPVRRWRLDWAWPAARVGLEVDGGIFVRGKHGRGAGILKDHEKRNELAAMGWRVLLCVPKALPHRETLALIRRTLDYQEAA